MVLSSRFTSSLNHTKGEKCSSPLKIVNIEATARTVTLPASSERTTKAVLEDIHTAICDQSYATLVRDANDEVENDIGRRASAMKFTEESPPADSSPSSLTTSTSPSHSDSFKPLLFDPDFGGCSDRSIESPFCDPVSIYWTV